MTRASRGRLGRIALSLLGLLALLVAGAFGARAVAHDGVVPEGVAMIAHAHCPGCGAGDRAPHHGQDRDGGHAVHSGCAVTCAHTAIPASAPLVGGGDLAAAMRPGAAPLLVGRSTRPEPEPPRRATRA